MFLRKKGQSTAEYAVLLGLVGAIAAGFLSVSLKGAVRSKGKQATNFLMQAGDDKLGGYSDVDVPLYTQEYNKTTVVGDRYVDQSVMEKGGSEKRKQVQASATDSISIETLDDSN